MEYLFSILIKITLDKNNKDIGKSRDMKQKNRNQIKLFYVLLKVLVIYMFNSKRII